MIRIVATSMMALVVGCSTTSGPPALPTVTPALPTASSGYATPSSSSLDSSVTITGTAPLLNTVTNNIVTQKDATYLISATGNTVNGYPEFVITYGGIPVTLTWNTANGRYEGINGNINILSYPLWSSPNGQLSMGWVNLNDSGTAVGSSFGMTVSGFNSSPSDVGGRTGTATFNGQGNIAVSSTDNVIFGSIDGNATLTANFANKTIQGSMNLTNVNSTTRGVTVIPTTVTLNPAAITSNTFNSTATIVPGDLGLQSAGAINLSGMFYGSGATAVGGYLSGTGNFAGVPALIYGAFAASQ